MAKTVEKGRSAETGKFVSIEYAQKHPSTTVVEKVKVGPIKRRKVSIPSTPFFYIKKALADFVYQLKPLLITQRKSFCNCREATSRSPLRSDRLGGAVRFP